MNNGLANHSIQKLLKELQYLVNELKNNSVGISQLELDLMKEKIRAIYDILCDVKIKNAPIPNKEDETIAQPILDMEPLREKKETPEATPGSAMDIEAEAEIADKNTATSHNIEKDQPLPSSEPTLSLFEEQVTNTDDNETKSVVEKIAEERPVESIGEVIQSKRIVNLKLAIGINEKFFFLNELFEGKMNEYNDAIEELDQKDTFKDAIVHIELLKENKNWDEDSEAYVQLKGFLERKFN